MHIIYIHGPWVVCEPYGTPCHPLGTTLKSASKQYTSNMYDLLNNKSSFRYIYLYKSIQHMAYIWYIYHHISI